MEYIELLMATLQQVPCKLPGELQSEAIALLNNPLLIGTVAAIGLVIALFGGPVLSFVAGALGLSADLSDWVAFFSLVKEAQDKKDPQKIDQAAERLANLLITLGAGKFDKVLDGLKVIKKGMAKIPGWRGLSGFVQLIDLVGVNKILQYRARPRVGIVGSAGDDLIKLATALENAPSVANALKKFPKVGETILEIGADAVELLAKLKTRVKDLDFEKFLEKLVDHPSILQDMSKAMMLSKDEAAQQGIIDVLVTFSTKLGKQEHNQTLSVEAMKRVANDLYNFLKDPQLAGNVSGDFAARFRRIHQQYDRSTPKKAEDADNQIKSIQAEIALAKDLVLGNTMLGKGKVLSLPEKSDGLQNPEFRFTSSTGSRTIETKTLTTPTLRRLVEKLTESTNQIQSRSSQGDLRGFIRINSTSNPPSWTTNDLRERIRSWLSEKENNNHIEFIEIIYYNEIGQLRKISFRETNGQVIEY